MRGYGWLAAAVAAAVLVPVCATAAPVSMTPSEAEIQEVYKGLQTNPEMRPVWREFISDFPDDAHQLASIVLARVKAHDMAGAKAAVGSFLTRFIVDNSPVIARAPDADLVHLAATTEALYSAVRERSETACATTFVSGGQGVIDESRPSEGGATRARAIAIFVAIKDGRRTPVERGALTPADADLTATQMKNGPQGDIFVAMMKGTTSTVSQPAPVQCAYGVALMHTAQIVPPATGARVMAVIMARVGGDHSHDLESGPKAFDLTARQFLDEMEQNPDGGSQFKLLDQAFPDALATIADKALAAGRAGGANAAISVLQQGGAELADAHRSEILEASDADIVRLASASARLYRALEIEDEPRCTSFAMGEALQAQMAPRSQLAAIDVGNRTIEAIADGRRSPTHRADATAADYRAMVDEMKRGKALQADIAAVGAHKLNSATPHVQCDATAAMLEAISRLPPDAAARMMVSTLNNAAKARKGPGS